MTSDAVCVLIATPLEPELVARIEAVDPRIRVVYEPAAPLRHGHAATAHLAGIPALAAVRHAAASR